MQQNNSEIIFTRTTKRDRLFSWPTVVFQLTHSRSGAEIGQLAIRRNVAEYIAANHQDGFRIRKNFWRNHWVYEGQEDRLFARIGLGFRPSISFADDTRYRMHLKRRWRLRRKADDEYMHLATFFHDETPVLTLQNNARMAFFSRDAYTPMSGTIATTRTDIRVICGLLLLFQITLLIRRAATT